jgi:2-polyprenyl-3-methyl-5-hydroxy-6-metoxy-1,4-benzoquinol methylase
MSDDPLAKAWRAYDANPSGLAEKARLVSLLHREPSQVPADRGAALAALIADPGVNPAHLSAAAWRHLARDTDLFAGGPDEIAARLETNAFALALLNEAFVALREAEIPLTAVRRWLLLGDRWGGFPKLAAALRAQAAHNGGAWLFDAQERAALSNEAAYRPKRPQSAAAQFDDDVTWKVAGQYEAWPYPQWTRVTRAAPTNLAAAMRRIDPDGPPLAEPAEILVAGCGTGHQAALTAAQFPNDRITAIDISAASLAYAKARCDALGLVGIDFRRLDLHAVAELGKRFDAILCTGVLHHLPDPEAGWAALEAVLKPGGAMHVMVYSRVARMRINALRRTLADLLDGPIDDDVLREARRRVLAMPQIAIPTGDDFFTLAGVHDLLLHRHEDPFDVPRIRRALERFGLGLVRFNIPVAATAEKYRAARPDDPLRRDFDGWLALERANPTLFARMYDFWCRKG